MAEPDLRAFPSGAIRPAPAELTLAAACVAALILLILPLRLPIGPFAFDIIPWLDGAHRIAAGQRAVVDFFTPAGAAGLYAAAATMALFPRAQPVLAAQYGLLLPTLLLMAAALRLHAIPPVRALLVAAPFALVALLPLNFTDLSPLQAGIDAFGVYNRQASLLLAVLVTALLAPSSRTGGWVVAATLVLLLLVKTTAFFAGAGLLGCAVVAGRLSWRDLLVPAAAGAVALVGLDLATGLLHAMTRDIAELAPLGSGSITSRLYAVISAELPTVAAMMALGGLLLWSERGMALRGSDGLGLWVLTAMCVAVESQNSGSTQFLYLWPALAIVVPDASPRVRPLAVVLALAVVLPAAAPTLGRAVRVAVASDLRGGADQRLFAWTQKTATAERGAAEIATMEAQPGLYAALAERGYEPSPRYMARLDAEAVYFRTVEDAVTALRRLDAPMPRSIGAIDYYDPFATLLGLPPLPGLATAHDPDRTLSPAQAARSVAALRQADALLVPRCPVTAQRLAIGRAFAGALEGRTPVALTPCWALYRRPAS